MLRGGGRVVASGNSSSFRVSDAAPQILLQSSTHCQHTNWCFISDGWQAFLYPESTPTTAGKGKTKLSGHVFPPPTERTAAPYGHHRTHIQDGERGQQADVLGQAPQLVGGQHQLGQVRLLPPAIRSTEGEVLAGFLGGVQIYPPDVLRHWAHKQRHIDRILLLSLSGCHSRSGFRMQTRRDI